MNFKQLKGLTIQDVIVEEHTIYDDDPSIVLWCTNGRKYRIEGGYEEGTDESASEMRSKLTLSSVNVKKNPELKVENLKVKEENVIYQVSRRDLAKLLSLPSWDERFNTFNRIISKDL